jgi:predicted transcriptional regulator
MNRETLQNPTNIRFDSATHARLQKVARQYSLTPSDLVRAAVLMKLQEWELAGNIVLVKRERKSA